MIIVSYLCLGCANPVLCFSRQDDQGQPTKAATQELPSKFPQSVLKTYTLKHIKPEAILDMALLYVIQAKYFENMLTVRIMDDQILKFEELLNKLDVEKKMIQFQVFAIVASRDLGEGQKMKETREQAAALALAMSLPSSTPKTSPSEKVKYTGDLITLKYKETDLRDVVLGLAQFARLNVIFDADVRGLVTCNFQDVPWDQALDIILKQNNMGKTLEGKMLRIAPVRILSREQNPEKGDVIENKDLKKVLDELKTLWNFKTYEVDGPSFLSVHEDSGPNNFKLVTNRALNLVVSNVKVLGDEAGKKTISIGQLKLTGMTNFADYVFIDTQDVTLKEKGYLVAGVSGYGSASNALILVISAEIK
jgi:hypothetical protein